MENFNYKPNRNNSMDKVLYQIFDRDLNKILKGIERGKVNARERRDYMNKIEFNKCGLTIPANSNNWRYVLIKF